MREESYPYFWLEVDVFRADQGGVYEFQSYSPKDPRRRLYTGITDRGGGVLHYKDRQTSETFDLMSLETQSYVRHHHAGGETFASQVAWATEKYHSFLRYFARAQIANLLHSERAAQAKAMSPEQLSALRDALMAFQPSLERLRRETGDPFATSSDEPFVAVHYLLAAMRDEEGAREAVEVCLPHTRARWSWEKYDAFYERLLSD